MPRLALVIDGPPGTENYRSSCLVDAGSGLPILLPVTPELEEIRVQAAQSAGRLLDALQE